MRRWVVFWIRENAMKTVKADIQPISQHVSGDVPCLLSVLMFTLTKNPLRSQFPRTPNAIRRNTNFQHD